MRSLITLLLFASIAQAQSPETIVDWHTLRVTANYEKDLAATKDDEFLFVWVGCIDLELFEKIKHLKNSYAETLPGVSTGLIIGKGRFLQEKFGKYSLTDPKTREYIVEKYALKSEVSRTLEEKLLLGKEIEKPIYPSRQINTVQPGMHKHECGACGFVWAHFPGGSHTCPNCHTGEWRYQYTGPKPALAVH